MNNTYQILIQSYRPFEALPHQDKNEIGYCFVILKATPSQVEGNYKAHAFRIGAGITAFD